MAISNSVFTANKRHWPKVCTLLFHHQRHWPNSDQISVRIHVLTWNEEERRCHDNGWWRHKCLLCCQGIWRGRDQMLIRSHQPGRDSWMVILPADDFSRVVFFPCELDTLTLITTMMSRHPKGNAIDTNIGVWNRLKTPINLSLEKSEKNWELPNPTHPPPLSIFFTQKNEKNKKSKLGLDLPTQFPPEFWMFFNLTKPLRT